MNLYNKTIKGILLLSLVFFTAKAFCMEQRLFKQYDFGSKIADYEKKPQLIKEQQDYTTNYRASDDFISGISFHYGMPIKDKQTLLDTLNLLLSDKESSAKQAEAFRQIEQTTLLTHQEKIEWLKERVNEVPAPFAMLLAKLVAHDNLEEAFKWRILSTIRMQIDASKCIDESVASGVEVIHSYFLDQLFALMVVHYVRTKGTDSVNNEFLNQEWEKRNKAGMLLALKYHQDNPYQITYPYWLANHGVKRMQPLLQTGSDFSRDEKFVPIDSWSISEQNLLQKYIAHANSQ